MATDLEPRSQTKYDAFVDKQLTEVQTRIRRLDVWRSLLWLGVTVLGYGLVMAVLDLFIHASNPGLADTIHLVSFVGFLGVAGFFFAQALYRTRREVNPRYAARQLELTNPDAKNSVINWIDLQEEKLPSAIRGALGVKAAKDLKKSDADQAVNPRSNWLLFSLFAGLVLGLLILLALRPNQFSSLMQRAYAPFQDIAVGTRVRIEMINPANGSLTLPPDRELEIRARITNVRVRTDGEGHPSLMFRYHPDDNPVPIRLNEQADSTWSINLKPDKIKTGFHYKVVAGDAQTEEFQIVARSDPKPVRFDVTYKYRPYVLKPEHTVTFPTGTPPVIQARRGTDVTLTVQTNRQLKEANLVFESAAEKLILEGKIQEDGASFKSEWRLEQSGTFRVMFTSKEDEPNSSAALYTVIVEDDPIPQIVLTEPKDHVKLPANGTLQVEGKASDDLGLRTIELRLKVLEGGSKPELKGKLFRGGKDFKFADGAYPTKLDYKDFLPLDQIQMHDGTPFPVHEKMVLEFWLEARDNSDYPTKEGNLGVSKSLKIFVQPPLVDDKQKQAERDKAAKAQQDFENQQDKKHDKDNKNRGAGGGADERPDTRSDAEKEKEEKAQKLAQQIEQERRERSPGEGKGEEGSKSETKGDEGNEGAEPKSKDAPKDAAAKTGDGKDGPKDKTQAADSRGGGDTKKEDKSTAAGEPKEAGKSGPPDAAAKGPEEKGGAEKGAGKEGPKDGMGSPPATAREEGDKKMGDGPGGANAEGPKKEAAPSAKTGDPKGDGPSASAKEDPKGKGTGGPAESATKKAPPKTEDVAKGKGSTSSGEPGKTKPGEPVASDPGGVRGDEKTEPRGSGKAGEKTDKSGKAPEGSAKGSKDDAKGMHHAKKDTPSKTPAADPRGDGARPDEKALRPEPTLEDVERLAEKMKDEKGKKGPNPGAAYDLAKIAEEAKDEKVRDAAREALEKNGRDPDNPFGKAKAIPESKKTPEDMGAPKGAGEDPKKADSETKKGTPGEADAAAKSDETKKSDEHATAKKGAIGEGGKGMFEKLEAEKAVKEFLEKGGSLQLEDLLRYLKNHGSADAVEKAGWSKEEYLEWLKAAEEYDRRRAADRLAVKDGDKVAGKGGIGVRPTLGSPTGKNTDPLVGGRGAPPPEFRDPHWRFRDILLEKSKK